MRMDWTWLGVTFLWVTGLAVLLSVWSVAYYRSANARVGLWTVFGRKKSLLAADAGALLFLAGLWMTAAPLEQKLVWSIGGVWLAVETFLAWRKK